MTQYDLLEELAEGIKENPHYQSLRPFLEDLPIQPGAVGGIAKFKKAAEGIRYHGVRADREARARQIYNEMGREAEDTIKPPTMRKSIEKVLIDFLEPTHPVDLRLPPSRSKGPIKVWRDVETNQMYIEDGHRRVRDAIRKGIKEIKAIITPVLNRPEEGGFLDLTKGGK